MAEAKGQLQALLVCGYGKTMQHFTDEAGNIEGPWIEQDLSRFDLRIVQDVVDQGEQIGRRRS